MDLLYNRIVLYNRIILYNRTTSSLVLFIFTGVTFGVFEKIYFHLALRHLILAGLRGECAVKTKYELNFYHSRAPTSVNLCKSFKTLHMPRNKNAAQISTQDFHKIDTLAQTNKIKYNGLFLFPLHEKHEKNYFLNI